MVSGFVSWGSEHLPEDLPLDLDEIRRWAIEGGLVFDEGQLLTGERVEKLKTIFTEEELRVAIIIAAKNVVEKFAALTKSLVGELPPDTVKRLSDGSIDVTIDGAVRAKFFKAGRRFDVEFLRHG